MNPQRDSACCRYSDGGGKTRYHSHPLNPKLEGAEFEAAADVAAEVFHEFWLANHCPKAEPAPDGGDAEPEPDGGDADEHEHIAANAADAHLGA